MDEIFITRHAIRRYQERVADVPAAQIWRVLDCRAIRTAISVGARYVRLAGGQRAVLCENRVITILPKETHESALDPARDPLFDDGEANAQG
ncbi:MAG: hypothetical protein ACK4IS_07195 [Erythrobacter sp.]